MEEFRDNSTRARGNGVRVGYFCKASTHARAREESWHKWGNSLKRLRTRARQKLEAAEYCNTSTRARGEAFRFTDTCGRQTEDSQLAHAKACHCLRAVPVESVTP